MGIQKVLGFEVGFCKSNGEGEKRQPEAERERERERILGFGASHASEICGGKCERERERERDRESDANALWIIFRSFLRFKVFVFFYTFEVSLF